MNFLILLSLNVGLVVLFFAIRTIKQTNEQSSTSKAQKTNIVEDINYKTFIYNNKSGAEKQLSIWSDLFKWLIGTVGLGLVGIIINNQIQKTDLNIKRIEADTKLLDVITKEKDILATASSDSLELRYLSFVRTFITTDSIKKAVDERKLELMTILQVRVTNSAVHMTKTETASAKQNLDLRQQNELSNIDAKLKKNNRLTDISAYKNEESKIAANISPIDSGAIASLNSVQKSITPSIFVKEDTNYILIASPVTKWCKSGYYVEFNNLRIGVNQVSTGNQAIEVNFRDVENEGEDPPLIKDNVTISVGETYILPHKWRYLITLNYIGAAGRNPFTKAAYLTVAIYQKS